MRFRPSAVLRNAPNPRPPLIQRLTRPISTHPLYTRITTLLHRIRALLPRPGPFTRILTQFLLYGAGLRIWINTHHIEVLNVVGPSMSPALNPHAHETGATQSVLFHRRSPSADLCRGDVVMFRTPHNPEATAITRVVALEGDLVWLDMRREGAKELGEGDRGVWLDRVTGGDGGDGVGVVVPPGHVWVEGDNGPRSRDSHYFGPLSRSLLTGRAARVVWPMEQFWEKPWEGPPSKSVRKRVVRDYDATMTDKEAFYSSWG